MIPDDTGERVAVTNRQRRLKINTQLARGDRGGRS